MTFIDNEPAITAGSVVALVTAIITVVIAFGAPITPDQQKAILSLVAVVAPLAAVLLTRPHVTPTLRVDEHVAQILTGAVVPPPPP